MSREAGGGSGDARLLTRLARAHPPLLVAPSVASWSRDDARVSSRAARSRFVLLSSPPNHRIIAASSIACHLVEHEHFVGRRAGRLVRDEL